MLNAKEKHNEYHTLLIFIILKQDLLYYYLQFQNTTFANWNKLWQYTKLKHNIKHISIWRLQHLQISILQKAAKWLGANSRQVGFTGPEPKWWGSFLTSLVRMTVFIYRPGCANTWISSAWVGLRFHNIRHKS